MSMNREQLVELHAAMSALLALPPSMLDEIARWLAPANPNGHDPHPPNGADLDPPPVASPRSTPHAGKGPAHWSTREPPSASSSPRCKPAPDYPSPRWLTPGMSAVRPWSAACSGSRQPGRSKRIAPADGGRSRRRRRGWSRALRRRRCEGGGRTRTRRARTGRAFAMAQTALDL